MEASSFRRDTVDLAEDCGWLVEFTRHTDEFNKDGITIAVQYTPDEEITSISRWGWGRPYEVLGHESTEKLERVRIWLSDPASVITMPPIPSGKAYVNFAQKPGDWTTEEFIAAVEDPGDRAFLLRMMELIDENMQQPQKGPHEHLYFGKRPGGAMFVYPFARRHPPFKFSVRNGRLLISGCWTKFPKVKGNPGFAELAGMLDLDERGPETAVAVAGLDPDEVWEVGERVSQAINEGS